MKTIASIAGWRLVVFTSGNGEIVAFNGLGHRYPHTFKSAEEAKKSLALSV